MFPHNRMTFRPTRLLRIEHLITGINQQPGSEVAGGVEVKRLRQPSLRIMVGVTVYPPPRLFGRSRELEILGRLIANARSGQSAVLVVRGEPGIGKTELLRHLIAQASGFVVARVAGVESEMELPFAGLHQLCAPMLGRLGSLAEPQRRGLSVAFGLASGDSPDRFLVALATLSLMAQTSEERPMLCVVDDAQRLGLDTAAVNLAAAAGLLGFGANVRFRHPLVRSAAYRAATAAFWERAVALTPDPGQRASRALAAAEAKYAAGDFEVAQALLVTAELGPLGELAEARVQRMRAQIAFALRRGGDAPPLMLRAAQRLQSLDAALARQTYLEALVAAIYAGRLAHGPDARQVAREGCGLAPRRWPAAPRTGARAWH